MGRRTLFLYDTAHAYSDLLIAACDTRRNNCIDLVKADNTRWQSAECDSRP